MLDTNLRAKKCVIAINIGLKTSNDLYTCFRRKTNQLCSYLCTRDLHNNKCLAYSCLCLCMLLPKHNVSSRDRCVVIGVMTGKEPTVLSGCMFACENVCDIRANGGYAYQCWDSFRGAISAPYTSFVSCALFYHHIVSLLILECNNKWAYSVRRLKLADIVRPREHHLQRLRGHYSKSKHLLYISSDQSHSVTTS